MSDAEPEWSPRDETREMADELGVTIDEVLLLSSQNDPMNIGTDTDHKKAAWFAELWEHAVADRDDKAIHVRGVHYATVMRDEVIEPHPGNRCKWDAYQNTTNCYAYLCDASVSARVLGHVPLDGIVDEKNDQHRLVTYTPHSRTPATGVIGPTTGIHTPLVPSVDDHATVEYNSYGEFVDWIATAGAKRLWRHGVELDTDRQQPYHIELWSEKTLPQAVKQTAERAGAAVIVEGEGELSYTVAKDFADRVNDAGKPGVVLYLSDFDPAGSSMARSMAAKINWLDTIDRLDHRVVIDKLAITADQVEKHGWPRKMVDDSEVPDQYATRLDEWTSNHGEGIVELNVLETDLAVFRQLVRDGITDLRDSTVHKDTTEAKEEWLEEAADAIRETFDSASVGGLEAVLEWRGELNSKLSDAEDTLDELNTLAEDDQRPKEWANSVLSAWGDVDAPEFDVPVGEAPPPNDPVFDTDRPYLENVDRTGWSE